MAGIFFKRKLKVTLSTLQKAYVYDETFKITFEVQRVAEATTPDKATIKIYNPLMNDVIESIQDAYVVIETGYETQTGIIYRGDVSAAMLYREENDVILEISAGDGEEANKKEEQKAYAKGTPQAKIILDIAQNLKLEFAAGLEKKINSIFTDKKKAKTIIKGVRSVQKLAELLKEKDYIPCITNNVLDIAETLKPTQDPAIVLTSETGLLDNPVRKKTKRKIGKKQEVLVDAISFKALLIPGLFPKRQIKIDSEFFTGFYVIESINYSGDTRGDDWQCNGEGILL